MTLKGDALSTNTPPFISLFVQQWAAAEIQLADTDELSSFCVTMDRFSAAQLL